MWSPATPYSSPSLYTATSSSCSRCDEFERNAKRYHAKCLAADAEVVRLNDRLRAKESLHREATKGAEVVKLTNELNKANTLIADYQKMETIHTATEAIMSAKIAELNAAITKANTIASQKELVTVKAEDQIGRAHV